MAQSGVDYLNASASMCRLSARVRILPRMPKRPPLPTAWVALVAAFFILAAPALAAHSQPESWQALTAQANSRQVVSALVVPKKNEVRVRLKDGLRYTAVYPSGGEQTAISLLRAHGASVIVHKAAKASSGHVRYRYIALAILALGALAALGYYLLRGRPAKPSADAPAAPGEPPPAPPAAAQGAARGEDGSPPSAGG
jgi:hypothetical protein